jgi:hypothetical protein
VPANAWAKKSAENNGANKAQGGNANKDAPFSYYNQRVLENAVLLGAELEDAKTRKANGKESETASSSSESSKKEGESESSSSTKDSEGEADKFTPPKCKQFKYDTLDRAAVCPVLRDRRDDEPVNETKIWRAHQGFELTIEYFEEHVKKLGFGTGKQNLKE